MLVGQLGEQRLDFAIALSDLLKQELVGGEVLLEREQVLGAIITGQSRHDISLRGVTAGVAMCSEPLRVALAGQDAA